MNRTPTLRKDSGFTLVELLVSLAVTTVLILGVLATFDFTARMNRVQMNVADMQQSLRVSQNEVVKLARMAGRGGLPANFAVRVTNNVPDNTRLVPAQPATAVLSGTDMVTVRGVFSSSLYQVEYLDPATWTSPDASGNGSVVVLEEAAGVPQDLAKLEEKLTETAGETLLLVTPFDTYAIAQIQDFAEVDDFKGTLDGLRLNFTAYSADAVLGGDLTPGFQAIAYVGILEEYVFYVRDVAAGGAAWAAGDIAPKLARARMWPGQNVPYEGDPSNAILDIADGILDLQATLGFGVAGAPELRLSTLARTDRRDPDTKFRAPLLPAMVEDHAYAAGHRFNADAQRRYRWRLMQSNINLRNL